MKKICTGLITICLFCTMTACYMEETTITKECVKVDKKGCVTGTLVDIFDKDYYDLNEVEAMAKSEISDYNTKAGRDAVTYGSVEKEASNLVKMTINYADPFSYSDFNEQVFFYGRIEDAYKAGYELNVDLYSASDREKKIGMDDILGMGDYYILITSVPTYLKLPGNIIYVSDNVTEINHKREADTKDDGNLVYVISK